MIDLDELRKKAEAANACDGGPITVDELRFIEAVTPSIVLELIERVEKAEAQLYRTPEDDEGKPEIGEPSYARQWALDTLSGAENGRRFIWGQRNLSRSYLNMEAEVARLRALLARAGEALKPFHTVDGAEPMDWTTDDGWSACAPKNERIRDWFGPHDFYTVRTVAAEIEKEISHD